MFTHLVDFFCAKCYFRRVKKIWRKNYLWQKNMFTYLAKAMPL